MQPTQPTQPTRPPTRQPTTTPPKNQTNPPETRRNPTTETHRVSRVPQQEPAAVLRALPRRLRLARPEVRVRRLGLRRCLRGLAPARRRQQRAGLLVRDAAGYGRRATRRGADRTPRRGAAGTASWHPPGCGLPPLGGKVAQLLCHVFEDASRLRVRHPFRRRPHRRLELLLELFCAFGKLF
jgi:hypothetical protein